MDVCMISLWLLGVNESKQKTSSVRAKVEAGSQWLPRVRGWKPEASGFRGSEQKWKLETSVASEGPSKGVDTGSRKPVGTPRGAEYEYSSSDWPGRMMC